MAVLHPEIPQDQRDAAARPLPGIQPLQDDWLRVDAAYAGQMAERGRLLSERRADVLGLCPEAVAPAQELLSVVLDKLGARPDFDIAGDRVTRPGGVAVTVNRDDPLHTLGHLITEDLCLLQKRGETHALTGAVLCFPAGWTLAEKIDRPLDLLHGPVAAYDDNIARRVQRLLDGVRVGRPIWRANLLPYADPALYQPRRESDPSRPHGPDEPYERSERQVLWRLPETGAVVFVIHTSVTQTCQAPQSPL